ncbi:hypothetical protein F2Q65_11525 [Thiohalocapsa marina]|uniref:Glycerophosphodiester phosphodiesterase n=1 Tax=Thiohalocapsa marina TaxID=424902 RepID=A0A5M8FL56_9GAMM|nr:hypothetical protein [Thiohalocapsa marina]KAA6184720.1 hypothetical protein F2Q65_11525 [Thiohalocapsa marina]
MAGRSAFRLWDILEAVCIVYIERVARAGKDRSIYDRGCGQLAQKNPTKKIVTDVVSRNTQAFFYFANRFPEVRDRFILQAYSPSDYFAAQELGFRDIIWTLYRSYLTDQAVLAHLRYMDLYALTMPVWRARRGLALKVEKFGVPVYVHTVNNIQDFYELEKFGVNSF